MRIVIDTNALLSFLTDRDLDQQSQVAVLFELALDGSTQLIIHQVVITEFVYVLQNLYSVEPTRIASMIGDLLALPQVLAIDAIRWTDVLEIWPSRVPDFADAVLCSVTRRERCDAIATFDRAFAKRLKKLGIKSYWTPGHA